MARKPSPRATATRKPAVESEGAVEGIGGAGAAAPFSGDTPTLLLPIVGSDPPIRRKPSAGTVLRRRGMFPPNEHGVAGLRLVILVVIVIVIESCRTDYDHDYD